MTAQHPAAPETEQVACICPTDDYCPKCHPRWHAKWIAEGCRCATSAGGHPCGVCVAAGSDTPAAPETETDANGVAETTAGEREVEALLLADCPCGHSIRAHDDEHICWGSECECERDRYEAILASDWLAALLDRVRREEGAKAWDEGWEAAWSPMSMSNRNDGPNPYRAAPVGRGEGL